MPARRTSSRLRAGLGASSSAPAAGAAGGTGGSDGESSGGGGGCPPLPPSPGKRKARSPIEEEHARLTNPNPVRCMSFQSPKKKALGGGIGDRFSAPYDKENELLFGAAASAAAIGGIGSMGNNSGGLLAPPFGDGSATTAFRLSAFSAFSHHAPKPVPAPVPAPVTTPTSAGGGVGGGSHAAQKAAAGGTRRRNREENVSSAVRTRAPPTSTTSPGALPGSSKGSVLPFLLAPVSVTTSPDLRPRSTPSSRRLRRSGGTVTSGSGGGGSGLGRSRQSSSSTSSSTSSNASGRGGGSPPDVASAVPFSIGESLQQQQRQQKRAEGVVAAPASTRQTTTPSFTPRRGRSRSAASNFSTGIGDGGSGGWGATAAAAAGPSTAAAAAAAAEAAASNPTAVTDTSGGGGPAGSGRRAVGGARLGPGGGGGGDTMSEPDCSPHRSPIYRLTESLQKWDAGSRYASPPEAMGEDYDGADVNDASADAVGTGGTGGRGGGAGVTGRGGAGGGATKDVGASWSGQELRRTLEKERASQGRRRRHSAASAHDMYPTRGRFGDHSPISPASSVASINLGPFDATTPASVGRPWRSSPRRGSENGGGGGGGGAGTGTGSGIGRRSSERVRGGGGDDGGSGEGQGAGAGAGGGSEERAGLVRMEGSWSDDETGPSGAAMKLAFSPGKTSDNRTPTGEELTPESAGSRAGAGAGSGVSLSSSSRWHHPFSPVKSQLPRADDLGGPSTPSLGSLALSANGDGAVPLVGGYLAASPEQHSMLSVRDLMDQGTDDEDDGRGSGGGGGAGAGATLVRRRHRRPRTELALRTLEMPDTMDVTVVEGVTVGALGATAPTPAAGSGATASGKKSAREGRGTTPNSLVSPKLVGKELERDGADFGSAFTTGCARWESLEESSVQLDGSSIISHDAPGTVVGDDSWIGSRYKGKGRDWGQSTSAFGVLAADEGQDATAALSRENSGLSGADTSSASDASTSFAKSRPIPDQSAFSSSRLSKGGAGAPHSPLGSSGGGSGGGPALGPGPLCLTPRKSIMRCPPTPQRTPTWDGLEDSLLLEGAGSGGRVCGGESAGMSSRHSLRQSRLLASGGAAGVGASAGAGGGARTGMAIDAGLANASGDPFSASILSAAGEAGFVSSRAGSGRGAGGHDDDGRGGVDGGTGGRGGRGRGGRERSGFGGSSAGDISGRGNAAKYAASLGAGGAGGGAASGGGDDTLGFKHDFVQMGPIGEGGFSVVWKVRARGTGRLYAIKRSKREFRGRRDRDRCLLEARALQRLGEHPGVLRFERAWQEEGHFCLQTELCELGTLKDFLERLPSRREIPEAAVWQVLQDVGQALRHVHATGLVHLDVKPANLLIGDEGGRLKLADFGMATAYGEGVDGVGDGQEGDTLYMAKELLSSTERLPSADMFSLGLTVFEVATRTELPGDGEDWHAMRDGRSVGLPSSRSKDLGAVLRQLMHPDPRQRPTASELCDHQRVANIVVSSDGTGGGGGGGEGSSGGGGGGGAGGAAAVTVAGHERDDYVVSQARAWRAAEAAAMNHPSSGLRTPTGDMSTRYIFQQTG